MLLELTSSHNGDQADLIHIYSLKLTLCFLKHFHCNFFNVFLLLAFFHYKLILTCLLFVENSKYLH